MRQRLDVPLSENGIYIDCFSLSYQDGTRNHGMVNNRILANSFCYTSKLKCVFQLEENVSHAVGQNSQTP